MKKITGTKKIALAHSWLDKNNFEYVGLDEKHGLIIYRKDDVRIELFHYFGSNDAAITFINIANNNRKMVLPINNTVAAFKQELDNAYKRVSE